MKHVKLLMLAALFLSVSTTGAQLKAHTRLAQKATSGSAIFSAGTQRQGRSAATKQASQAGSAKVDAFATFYTQLRDAINKQDRAKLRDLMSPSFEWAGDGKVSAAEAVKYIDLIGTWKSFKKTVVGKTVACKKNDPSCWHYALPARRTVGPNWLLFQQDASGNWKWVAFLAD